MALRGCAGGGSIGAPVSMRSASFRAASRASAKAHRRIVAERVAALLAADAVAQCPGSSPDADSEVEAGKDVVGVVAGWQRGESGGGEFLFFHGQGVPFSGTIPAQHPYNICKHVKPYQNMSINNFNGLLGVTD